MKKVDRGRGIQKVNIFKSTMYAFPETRGAWNDWYGGMSKIQKKERKQEKPETKKHKRKKGVGMEEKEEQLPFKSLIIRLLSHPLC